MMSIFSCACWESICPLWRIVYLGLLPIFQLDCLGFLLFSCVSWKLDYKSMKLIFICGLYDYSYCFEVIYSVLMIFFFSAWGAENSKIAYSGLAILVRTKSCPFCKQFFQPLLHHFTVMMSSLWILVYLKTNILWVSTVYQALFEVLEL